MNIKAHTLELWVYTQPHRQTGVPPVSPTCVNFAQCLKILPIDVGECFFEKWRCLCEMQRGCRLDKYNTALLIMHTPVASLAA